MDIRHMRQILAVRDHGSFAKAAAALNMAQPALSKSLAKVEVELGLTIFTRTSAGSELTPMGEMIAERAEKVVAASQNLARDAALVAGGDTGVLRLGVGTLLKDTLLPELLVRTVRAHPRLRLEIEFGTSERLLPLLHSREIDLVLCSQASDTTLGYAEALQADIVFVANPDHPLAQEGPISIDRLADFPCAGPITSRYTPSTLLNRPDASETLAAYVTNDFEAVMPLVYAGQATLMAPSFFVQRDLMAGKLVRLDVDWSGTISFGCYTTRAVGFSPVLANLIRNAEDAGSRIQASWRELAA